MDDSRNGQTDDANVALLIKAGFAAAICHAASAAGRWRRPL
jgi:hypothetical protein